MNKDVCKSVYLGDYVYEYKVYADGNISFGVTHIPSGVNNLFIRRDESDILSGYYYYKVGNTDDVMCSIMSVSTNVVNQILEFIIKPRSTRDILSLRALVGLGVSLLKGYDRNLITQVVTDGGLMRKLLNANLYLDLRVDDTNRFIVGKKHEKPIKDTTNTSGLYRARLIDVFSKGTPLSDTLQDYTKVTTCDLDGRYHPHIRSVNTYLKYRFGIELLVIRPDIRTFKYVIAIKSEVSIHTISKYLKEYNKSSEGLVDVLYGEFPCIK